jgi:hypothetical protein
MLDVPQNFLCTFTFGLFPDNLGAVREEQGKKFHQDISVME